MKEELQLHLELITTKFRSVIHQEKENVKLTTYESGQIFHVKNITLKTRFVDSSVLV